MGGQYVDIPDCERLIIIIDIKHNLMSIFDLIFLSIYYVRIAGGGGSSILIIVCLFFWGGAGLEITKIILH